jgi:penicillin amidase
MSRAASLAVMGAMWVSLLLAGCTVLTPLPRPTTLDERLAALPTTKLPVARPVTISWDDHAVPFIEAETDEDLAFALGLVHAHLRLGQMELLRHISQGRTAEMVGPIATDVDKSLRILNFGRAAGDIEAALPPATRLWLAAFVRGVNHYVANVRDLPHEFAVLGLKREKWTVRDLLTVGRLAASDVNWLIWFAVLELRQRPDWPQIWARLVREGGDSTVSFTANTEGAALREMILGAGKVGSNSWVVSAAHSRSGAPLMANDPHLGVQLPNLWLIAGVKSPSYHAVGLMIPGIPVIAVGRNPTIAWGGTNMRAAVSDLYDATKLVARGATERTETIAVRWWLDDTIKVRETPLGPVLSDAPLLKDKTTTPFVMHWEGHQVSDEITALLEVSRATSFAEFRAAFKSFAVSGQNMLYADKAGNIGEVMAVRLPGRGRATPPDLVLDPDDPAARWHGALDATTLPAVLNPPSGVLASANNRPARTPVPVGYFFSPDDRIERLGALLGGGRRFGLDDFKAMQRDVTMPSALALRDLLIARLDASGVAAAAEGAERALLDALRAWDGAWTAGSRGALAYELFRVHVERAIYARRLDPALAAMVTNFARSSEILRDEIERSDPAALAADLRTALGRAAERFGAFRDWGEMHRLVLAHPFANIPLLGGRYRFGDLRASGNSDTLMKTAHASTDRRHATRYGSQARHVSDLADMDENYFVLLGGQDGWLGSANFIDQMPLWQDGGYIRVPLRPATVHATFRRRTVLQPGAGGP